MLFLIVIHLVLLPIAWETFVWICFRNPGYIIKHLGSSLKLLAPLPPDLSNQNLWASGYWSQKKKQTPSPLRVIGLRSPSWERIPLILQACSSEQQSQHLGVCWKGRNSGPNLDLLNQIILFFLQDAQIIYMHTKVSEAVVQTQERFD